MEIKPKKLRQIRAIIKRSRLRCGLCDKIHSFDMLNDETKRALAESLAGIGLSKPMSVEEFFKNLDNEDADLWPEPTPETLSNRYTCIHENDGGYTLIHKRIDGAISYGDTFKEALNNMADAIELIINTRKDFRSRDGKREPIE